MKKAIYFILYFLSAQASANKLDEVASTAGISKDDLKLVWHGGRCEPNWTITLEKSTFEDASSLGHIATKAKFFNAKELNGKIVISPGEKCSAMNDYYFKQVENDVIREFISKDKAFSKNYGFSVLDALYIERTESFSWNGEVGSFNLKYVQSLKSKGLFTITEENSSFNGISSRAYSGKITAIGQAFYERVFQ